MDMGDSKLLYFEIINKKEEETFLGRGLAQPYQG